MWPHKKNPVHKLQKMMSSRGKSFAAMPLTPEVEDDSFETDATAEAPEADKQHATMTPSQPRPMSRLKPSRPWSFEAAALSTSASNVVDRASVSVQRRLTLSASSPGLLQARTDEGGTSSPSAVSVASSSQALDTPPQTPNTPPTPQTPLRTPEDVEHLVAKAAEEAAARAREEARASLLAAEEQVRSSQAERDAVKKLAASERRSLEESTKRAVRAKADETAKAVAAAREQALKEARHQAEREREEAVAAAVAAATEATRSAVHQEVIREKEAALAAAAREKQAAVAAAEQALRETFEGEVQRYRASTADLAVRFRAAQAAEAEAAREQGRAELAAAVQAAKMTARVEAQRDAEAAIAAAVEAATAVARREASREREAIEAAALRAEAALAAQRQEEARRTAEFEALTAAMEASNSFSMSLRSSARVADLNSPPSPTLRGGESGRRTPDWLQKAVSDLADADGMAVTHEHADKEEDAPLPPALAVPTDSSRARESLAAASVASAASCGEDGTPPWQSTPSMVEGVTHAAHESAAPAPGDVVPPYVPYVSQQEVRHLPMMPPRDTMTESAAASLRNTMRTHAELHVSWSLYMKLAMRSVANTMTCSR